MVEPAIFGPLDAVFAPWIEFVVLGLVLVNLATRYVAHRAHVRQAEEGADAVSRYPLHELSNGLLVLASFYYLSIDLHGGTVLSVLVLGVVVADIFEFEARKVEARNDMGIDAPKGSLFGSALVFLYAAYISILPTGPVGQFFFILP